MDEWNQYSEIKALVDDYFVLQREKHYEDFIKELAKILNI